MIRIQDCPSQQNDFWWDALWILDMLNSGQKWFLKIQDSQSALIQHIKIDLSGFFGEIASADFHIINK